MRYTLIPLFLLLPVLSWGEAEPPPEKTEWKVAILGGGHGIGHSRSEENQKALGLLLQGLKTHHPDAVFFTGNLILEKPPIEGAGGDHILESSFDIHTRNTRVETHPYSRTWFEEQTNTLSELIKNNLGTDIPFYPLVGVQEVVGPDSQNLFMKNFGIAPTILDEGRMGYAVSLGNSFFVLLATDYFDDTRNERVENSMTRPALHWLQNTLQNEKGKVPYLFVIGHKPAFSPTWMAGLDANQRERDQFWNILQNNGVLAYFSGYENLYDRSFRTGVWQLISGGVSPAERKEFVRAAFFHYLLLTIPKDPRKVPKLEVIDLRGNVRDEFFLVPEKKSLFQLRLS